MRTPSCLPAALLALLLLPVAGRANTADTGPFSNVPQQHWAYDCVEQLSRSGFFTGYPAGTFSGKKALTRYEFAVALQRILNDVERGKQEVTTFLHSDRICAAKLIEVFSPELGMLGMEPAQLERSLRSLLTPWRGDAPDLAVCSTAIYPGVGTAADPEYRRGQQWAAQEWARGEAVFYVAPASRSLRISASTGVLYRTLDTRADEPGKLSLIAGHNAEVKRRLERYGAPASAHPDWVRQARNPEGPWQAGPPHARLDASQREAASRNAELLVRLEEQGRGRPPLLRVTSSEGTRELPLRGFELSRDTLEVCWAPQFDLLHLAHRVPGREQVRVRVVELRHGETLHEVEVPAASLRSSTRSSVQNVYPLIDPSP